MQAEFWRERWERNEIGFHIHKTNPNLLKHWHRTQLQAGDTVFVPLCGKTLDLLWFVEQGFNVVGVELVESAVQAFFAENNLAYLCQTQGAFTVYISDNITIYCGDFFQLSKEMLTQCSGFYDRAALVSWSDALRQQYAQHLCSILPAQCQGLLLVVDYLQEQMTGPPFAIDQTMIDAFFAVHCDYRLLDVRDILKYEKKFQERGLHRLEEHIYWLKKVR
ncbi:thiopurine S-methyltransferase [Pseudomonas sp. F1_0610]|uniref:thiopurine S-methyltransferase n=1 Tax=Pseudomonas sp. F1_0610 TaxID=3114284 RepID=UPI0039C09CEE